MKNKDMMNTNFKTVNFYDDVYKQNILFCIGDYERSKKCICKWINDDMEFDWNYGGLTFDYTYISKGMIVWLCEFSYKPNDFGYLSHEIAHVTFLTMRNCGIKFCKRSYNEAYTYYIEFLTRRFLEELEKIKK
jgi:hypothetical protein